jgi:hypothetical protein
MRYSKDTMGRSFDKLNMTFLREAQTDSKKREGEIGNDL